MGSFSQLPVPATYQSLAVSHLDAACRTSHIFMLIMRAIKKKGRQKRATQRCREATSTYRSDCANVRNLFQIGTGKQPFLYRSSL